MANKASKLARRENLEKQLGIRPLGAPTANNIRRLLNGEETVLAPARKKNKPAVEEYKINPSEFEGEVGLSEGKYTWNELKTAIDMSK